MDFADEEEAHVGGTGTGSSSSSKGNYYVNPHLSSSSSSTSHMGSWLANKFNPQEDHDHHHLMDQTHQQQPPQEQVLNIQKEHMFDKVVTPSDVGKLNRLVIPKQHAEKYFPLDSSTNEKGLLLNFEDRNGKPWRFRYSYWNSSQSYVMTKGWSRFVKEKKLDAGDIVSFQRGVGDDFKDRLYIDYRRRPEPHLNGQIPNLPFHHSIPWSPLLMRPPSGIMPRGDHMYRGVGGGFNYGYTPGVYLRGQQTGMMMRMQWNSDRDRDQEYYHDHHHHHYHQQRLQQQQQQQQQLSHVVEPMVYESVPVVQGKVAAKRLRLFGVNMDCPVSSEEKDESNILSSTSISTSTPSPQSTMFYNGTPLTHNSEFQFMNKGSGSGSLDFDI